MGLIENNSALVKWRHGEVGFGIGLEYRLYLQCDLFSSASPLNCASSVTMAMMNDKKNLVSLFNEANSAINPTTLASLYQ